jgi:hypothetical protein
MDGCVAGLARSEEDLGVKPLGAEHLLHLRRGVERRL